MSFFGSIIGTLSKVVTTGVTVFKTALPILKALRPAVDEVDEAFAFIEGKIATGGVEADDFLDRNLDTLVAIEHATGKGAVVMKQLNGLAVKLRVYSQEQTPDTLTEAEMTDLGESILELRSLLSGWKPELDVAIEKMSALD